ncbi:hypothetical protein HK102_005818 [Quaeritorhiza haematococci]|nr:hypothetical protein HK102_005818 [Quaeritorhiza haematococci]
MATTLTPTSLNSILFITTNHSSFPSPSSTTSTASTTSDYQTTGYDLEEMAYLHYALSNAVRDNLIVFATPSGGKAPVDPRSIDRCRSKKDKIAMDFLKDEALMRACVVFPGGHGPLFDVANSKAVANMVTSVWARGGVIGAICHGPAGLLNAADIDETGATVPLVKNKEVTCFTNAEEKKGGFVKRLPFLLEDRLRESGVKFKSADKPGDACVVVDGNLITGQNPASAIGVGENIVATLRAVLGKEAVAQAFGGVHRPLEE